MVQTYHLNLWTLAKRTNDVSLESPRSSPGDFFSPPHINAKVKKQAYGSPENVPLRKSTLHANTRIGYLAEVQKTPRSHRSDYDNRSTGARSSASSTNHSRSKYSQAEVWLIRLILHGLAWLNFFFFFFHVLLSLH